MKRFWKDVAVAPAAGGFQITLDGRPLRTQGGAAQILPGAGLADLLAEEWRNQGDEIDPAAFPMRDMADFAIDKVRADRADTITRMLAYAETDTLCYRADPDEPLFRRQQELWEPLTSAAEARLGVRFERISGIIHRPQPAATMDRLRAVLAAQDDFTLAAINTLAPLAASMITALAVLEPGADADALFTAANCEEDWQAEQWGWEWTAEELRARRLAAFLAAARFASLARSGLAR
ncbi:MAG: hypothetical protein RLZZ08_1057 [Pseudomonadota bacterium]|jgi:chaperone required for assembly of F1-ATPase